MEYLKAKELVDQLGISRSSLHNFRKEGMPCKKINNNFFLYNLVEVTEWLEQRKCKKDGNYEELSQGSQLHRSMTDKEIVERYKSGQSTTNISKVAGITARAIRNILHKHNVSVDHPGQPRQHQVNQNFFKVWNHQMAWVTGLILTDGFISKDGKSLSITQKNTKILRTIANYLQTDYKLAKGGSTRLTPTIKIYSKEIVKDLNSLGITYKKSLTVPFPKVPEEYLPSFIRGVIDGDGWVQKQGYVMNVTTGSKEFAIGLKKVFTDWKLRCEISEEISPSKGKNTIYRVWVKGKEDLPRLAEIIYKSCLENDFIDYKREYMSQRKTG